MRPVRPPDELLYDSEASLRLVDHAIEELNESYGFGDGEAYGSHGTADAEPGQFAELSRTLLRAYAETACIVQRIRESASELGADASLDDGVPAEARKGFSVATEAATNAILDSIARAFAIVERLDTAGDAERNELMDSLKDELSGVTGHLHPKDAPPQ